MKKFFLAALLLTALIFTCGCAKIDSSTDLMLEYMNSKYNDTFEFQKPYGGSIGSDTRKIIVSSEKYPNEEVYVSYFPSNTDNQFRDNYLSVKFEQETIDSIKQRISKCFGDNFYLWYSPHNLSFVENGSDSTPFSEFIAAPTNGVMFEAVIYYDSASQSHDSIMDAINNAFSDMRVTGFIYFMDSDAAYPGPDGEIDALRCLDSKGYNEKLYFRKSSVSEFSTVEWTPGT